MYLHALAKLATAEEIKLRNLSVWVQRFTAKLFASALSRLFGGNVQHCDCLSAKTELYTTTQLTKVLIVH